MQNPGSDAGAIMTLGQPDQTGLPHPRSFGNATRVIAEYVKKRHVLTLEDAVREAQALGVLVPVVKTQRGTGDPPVLVASLTRASRPCHNETDMKKAIALFVLLFASALCAKDVSVKDFGATGDGGAAGHCGQCRPAPRPHTRSH